MKLWKSINWQTESRYQIYTQYPQSTRADSGCVCDMFHLLQVQHTDVRLQQTLLQNTDVLIMNNVFEFFMEPSEQAWWENTKCTSKLRKVCMRQQRLMFSGWWHDRLQCFRVSWDRCGWTVANMVLRDLCSVLSTDERVGRWPAQLYCCCRCEGSLVPEYDCDQCKVRWLLR